MFDAWYENWWFEHDVDKPAMKPKEAMRQAWEAGRKAQIAAQQITASDGAWVCARCGHNATSKYCSNCDLPFPPRA